MDHLDLLKKDWKNQEGKLPILSKAELTKLIYKKSSSIVKWIFIISLLEFVIPLLITMFTGYEKSIKGFEELGLSNEALGLSNFMTIFYAIYYVVIIYFIYIFYRNYRSISANSNPKILMQNIIKTRKTVKYYIWFNLALIPVIFIVVLNKVFHAPEFLEKIPEDTNMVIVWLLTLLMILIVVVLFWLFYRLIYGILLNKLQRNYNELVSNGIEEL